MKKRTIFSLVIVVVLVLAVSVFHPIVRWNNHKLQKAVQSLEAGVVNWNEVVPFAWDAVYTFDPYTTTEQIEETIGFSSRSIQETVNEGMVQMLFVKDKRVVASVCGYPDSLGYAVSFQDKITYADNAQFIVAVQDGIVLLNQK